MIKKVLAVFIIVSIVINGVLIPPKGDIFAEDSFKGPSAPVNLTAKRSVNEVKLQWDKNSEDNNAQFYKVYRGNKIIGTTENPEFIDREYIKGDINAYTVTVVDSVYNESSESNGVVVGPYVDIAAGQYFTAALKEDGSVWTWGINKYGQLGNGTINDIHQPTKVPGIKEVKAIAAGSDYMIALKEDGTVWAWGINDNGQLGDGSTSKYETTPKPLMSLSGVLEVAAGSYYAAALKSDGTVWIWGSGGSGRLSRPVKDPGISGARSLAAGSFHIVLLKQDGTVWTYGANDNGQLGNGSTQDSTVFQQVKGINDVVEIDAESDFTIALTKDGSVWSWGENFFGQLGDGTNQNKLTPVKASGITGVKAVSAGGIHSTALREDGTIWSWGSNVDGQLGDGTNTSSLTPVQACNLNGMTKLSAGFAHNIALKDDGNIWVWGDNRNGGLGDDTKYDKNAPIMLETADTALPTQPTGISIIQKTSSSLTLKWTASEDNVGIDYYEVYRNSSLIGITKNTFFVDTEPKSGNNYVYSIKAIDTSRNKSNPSNEFSYLFEEPTATPIATSMPTNTPTNTPTPTNILAIKISGYIALDFNYGEEVGSIIRAGFKVECAETDIIALTDAKGYFELNNLPVDVSTYNIRISKTNYLSREINNLPSELNKQLGSFHSPILMWAGNMEIAGSQDDVINMADIIEVIKKFNTCTGDENYSINSDFNMDGAINISDIMIAVKHFNKCSADYPAI